jgi:hypothetical protein
MAPRPWANRAANNNHAMEKRALDGKQPVRLRVSVKSLATHLR